MTELVMRRTLAGFEPTSDEDRESLRHIKVGDLVRVEVTRPRHLERLKLYWSLCALVAENHPEIRSRELASDTIKVLAGHCDPVQVGDSIYKFPKSISFANMEELDFQNFLREAMRVVAEDLLGSAPETVRAELARRIT